jgi:hypothetical protein
MAKLSIIDPGFVDDLVQRCMDVCDSLKSQDMANIAWSLAKMGVVHQRMFSIICERISNRRGIINHFKPMEIASTTWAFGTVGAKGMGVADISPVIESLVSECLSRDLRDFSPQALANVLWALAKLQYPHERLFRVFGDHVVDVQRLREFKPQEIANVVWSMQSVKLVHHRLYAEIVQGRSVNWSVFDPHALATVCGAMMELVDLNFALVIASRVLSSKLKSGYSISHCGVLLCEISPHLAHPTVATAASMLTEKLLADVSFGTAVDIHAVRGLVATLPDSPKVIDQLARCVLVESEYGISSQLANAVYVLKKLSNPELSRKVVILAKSIGFSSAGSVSSLAGLVSETQRLGLMDEEVIAGCEQLLSKSDLMNSTSFKIDDTVPLLSAIMDGTPSSRLVTIARLLAASCIEKIKDASADTVGDLVLAVNRLDFASASASADEVALAVVAAAVSDCMFGRPFDYSGDAFSKVLFGSAEFVSRRAGTVSVEPHVKALCQLGVSMGATQGYTSAFSLSALARLLAAAYSLELEPVYKSVISTCVSQGALLSQCVQSGPGGLRLLRESIDSFSVYCKVLAAHVMGGVLPGSWVQPNEPLSAKDIQDPFSLEGVLSLSVALGHVGAVDAQKDVIGNWVLPLMGGSAVMGEQHISGSANPLLGALMFSPQIRSSSRQERLQSFSEIFAQWTSTGDNFDLPQ